MDKDGIYFTNSTKWGFRLGHLNKANFDNKLDCAKAYVSAIIDKTPKYRELLTGKTWKEIFRIVGLTV